MKYWLFKSEPEVFSLKDLKLLDPRSSLKYLSELLFGLSPSYGLHWAFPFFFLILLMWGSLMILLRQIKAVEVVKS